MSMNDPVLSQLAQKSGIKLGTVASMFRIEITVSRGKANFQLHVILGRDGAIPGANSAKSRKNIKSISPQNQKIKYPLRILSMRENENLID